VFVFGGNASQAQALTFNGSAWKIGPTSVHGPRMRLVGGALPGGSILSAAGMVNGSVTATSEIYDFATNTFAATQPMVRATQWAAAATLPSGKVLVTGGSDQLANPMPSCQIFDPATRSWTMTASMTTPREHHAMAVLTDGKALVTGGVVGGSNALSTAEIFDPIIATWTQVPAMPFTASDHKMVALSDGRVMVVGSDMAALFDPISRTWQISNVFPTNLRGASVVKVGELIVVAGGQTSAAYIWDSRSQVWSSLRALSMPRSFMGASVSAGSFVLLTGGQDPGGNLLTLTEQSH